MLKFRIGKLIFLLTITGYLSAPALNCAAQDKPRLEVDRSEKSDTQMIQIEGVVVERKKYSIVIRQGEKNHEIHIPDSVEIVLDLNRPLFDFQKKTVSVVPRGKTKAARTVFPFDGRLFVRATFAHQRQYQRFLDSAVKRLGNYTVSPARPFAKPLEASGKKLLTGELLDGTAGRESRLKTDSQEYKVILTTGGQLLGQTVLSLEPESTFVVLVGVRDGTRVIARQIVFWPIVSVPAVDKQESSDK